MKQFCIIESQKGSFIYTSTETGRKWRQLYHRVPKFAMSDYGRPCMVIGDWAEKKGPLITKRRFMQKYGDTDTFQCTNLSIEEFNDYIADHFDEFL